MFSLVKKSEKDREKIKQNVTRVTVFLLIVTKRERGKVKSESVF